MRKFLICIYFLFPGFFSFAQFPHFQITSPVDSACIADSGFSFNDRIHKVVNFNSEGFAIELANLDTVANEVAPQFNFAFSHKALRIMAEKLRTDTSLENCYDINPNASSRTTISFGKIPLTWSCKGKCFYFEGKVPLYSIENKKVGKYVHLVLLFSLRRAGNICKILIEGDSANWYSFVFSNRIMTGKSSQETFDKNVCRKFLVSRSRGKRGNANYYQYTSGSDSERTLILAFVKRIIEQPN